MQLFEATSLQLIEGIAILVVDLLMNKTSLALLLITMIITSVYSQNKQLSDSLKSELQVVKNDSLKKAILFQLSRDNPNPTEKLNYSNQLLELATENGDFLHQIRANQLKARAFKLLGNLNQALEASLKALEISSLNEIHDGISVSCNIVASIYRQQGDLKLAVQYYNRSIAINISAKDSLYLAADYNNLGEAYRIFDLMDSALINFNKSKVIYDRLRIPIGVAYVKGNIGLVYAERGQNQLAEDNITEASNILQELGDRYPIAVYNTYMADIYNEKGDFNRALEYAQKSLVIGQEEGLKEQIRDASLKLSELYQSSGQFENAYKYQSQYIAYRDSINNEEIIRKMAEREIQYQVGQKQAELELVEARQQAERERSYLIGGALLAVLILIGIIAYIQYKSSKQRKATNIQLAAQKQELEQLNQTKDRFFSIISHDLRGPVNAFAGISKLIKMYLRKGKVEEINDMAEDIDESAGRLSSLLDNLLEWAVQQQGQFPYTPEKINFNKITKELEATFETTASGKEINLHSKIKEDIFLFVDKNSVTTIFRNLVGNALKFTPEGGEVFFDAVIKNESVLLSVNDTGVGIPKDKFDKLFTLSENKSTWGTSGEKGLGLGLQLAYEFTEMNKGAITVESTEGKGTSFIVELPLFDEEIIVPLEA